MIKKWRIFSNYQPFDNILGKTTPDKDEKTKEAAQEESSDESEDESESDDDDEDDSESDSESDEEQTEQTKRERAIARISKVKPTKKRNCAFDFISLSNCVIWETNLTYARHHNHT